MMNGRMRKPVNRNSRRRKLPPLDTAAGQESVERARRMLNDRDPPPADGVEVVPYLAWTHILPGFMEARAKALYACRTCEAELGIFRQFAATEDEQQRIEIAALEELRMGRQPVDVLSSISRYSPPEMHAQAVRSIMLKAPQAMRDAGKLQTPSYFIDFAAEMKAAGTAEFSEEAVLTATTAFGRTASFLRFLFPRFWITAGLWMAEMPDVAAWFATRQRLLPCWSSLTLPKESTLREWKSDLRLLSYRGEGRLHFDQRGFPRPSGSLQKAVMRLCDDHPEGELVRESFLRFESKD